MVSKAFCFFRQQRVIQSQSLGQVQKSQASDFTLIKTLNKIITNIEYAREVENCFIKPH